MMKYFRIILGISLLQGCQIPVGAVALPSPQPTVAGNALSPSPSPSPTPKPLPVPVLPLSPVPPLPASAPFTNLKPSSDSRIIYVSQNGNDLNNGLSPKTPLKTIQKAESLMRATFPDWLLLRKGDVWKNEILAGSLGFWTKGGRSSSEPMVISSYSDPLAPSKVRPEIDTADKTAFHSGWHVNHLFIVGLYLHASTRDPYSKDYAYPAGLANGPNPSGLVWAPYSDDTLIEDCVIDSYANGLTIDGDPEPLQNISNVRLRKNIIKNAFSNNRSQGLYVGSVKNILLEENVFDHNGWTENTAVTKTWNFMAQNHNAYLRWDLSGVVVKNNIFVSGAGHGLESRSGGIIQNNILVANAAGIAFGLTNGASGTKGGVTGEASGNLILDGRGGTDGAFCLEIGNIMPGLNTRIHDNACLREAGDPNHYGTAIMFDIGNGVTNPKDEVGVNDLILEKNIIFGWARGILVSKGFVPGSIGQTALKNLIIRNNDFQSIPSKIMNIQAALDPKAEILSGNRYSSSTNRDLLFFGPNFSGWANWIQKLEPSASWAIVSYADIDNAKLESFNKSKGGPGTLADFLLDIEKQSKDNWREDRSILAVVAFLKAKIGQLP